MSNLNSSAEISAAIAETEQTISDLRELRDVLHSDGAKHTAELYNSKIQEEKEHLEYLKEALIDMNKPGGPG